MRRVVFFGCGLMAAVVVWGQAPPVNTPELQVQPISNQVVRGAPFSAVEVTSTTQTLEDGNRIVHTNQRKLYRDSQGRERAEQTPTLVVLAQRTAVKHVYVTITDPVAGVTTNLNPAGEKTARQVARVNASLGNMSVFRPPQEGTTVTEQLAPDTVDGVYATGTRTTTTIPAGKVGNEKDLNVVDETWYSPDLQLNVKTRHFDPRGGETVYELTQISRTEPDPSLFQIPADYKITRVGQRTTVNGTEIHVLPAK